MSRPSVVAKRVEKSFGDEDVLEGVDLTVDSGELLAVLGPNGVGKSVLFSCLAGSQHPSAGTIEVFGADPVTRSDTTSFVLQDALCVDRLTGRENLQFYERLHPHFTNDWREYVDRLEIEDDLEKRVEDYSGGMVRKLKLAIALSIDVPLYLLDEPTAALDLSTIQTVHGLIREKQSEGKTVIISSHRPMDADIADRIAFVADGRVVASGPPESLFEDVPRVVETTLSNADRLDSVVAGEVFRGNGTIRGFLPPGVSSLVPENEERSDDRVPIEERSELEVVDPTYTDLFNYHTNGSSSNDDLE